MKLPAALISVIAAGGFKLLVLVVVIDLVSFALVLTARRLLSDATIEYKPFVIRCFLSTRTSRRKISR